MKTGIDRLLADPELLRQLHGRRVALVAHPASVTDKLVHSLDALIGAGVNITSAFGPQHGLKGDKQDNMVETADEFDPAYGIPIFSLYGEVRRPTPATMASAAETPRRRGGAVVPLIASGLVDSCCCCYLREADPCLVSSMEGKAKESDE